MARTPPAIIRPQLLTWARESIGLSIEDAARRVRVEPARLESWESGDASPTVAQLRNLANVYKRPLGVFYLPEPPLDFMPLADYRLLPEAEQELSPSLLLEIRRAQEQRELHLELIEELGDEPPAAERLRLDIGSDPEQAGLALRNLLQLSLEEQFSWTDSYQALNGWIAAIESVGYLVMQASGVGLTEMRGFSIAEEIFPVIVLNGADAPNGRIFTLLHEAAHIQLSASGICDLHERGDRLADAIEVFCNHVAAAALMPRESFLDDPGVATGDGNDHWPNEALAPLARRYSVSREAVLRRLLTFGKVTEDYYREKRLEFLETYQRRREESEGFAPVAAIRVRDLGRPYVTTVLDAFYQRHITAADLSRLLGARLKHLDRIEATVKREA